MEEDIQNQNFFFNNIKSQNIFFDSLQNQNKIYGSLQNQHIHFDSIENQNLYKDYLKNWSDPTELSNKMNYIKYYVKGLHIVEQEIEIDIQFEIWKIIYFMLASCMIFALFLAISIYIYHKYFVLQSLMETVEDELVHDNFNKKRLNKEINLNIDNPIIHIDQPIVMGINRVITYIPEGISSLIDENNIGNRLLIIQKNESVESFEPYKSSKSSSSSSGIRFCISSQEKNINGSFKLQFENAKFNKDFQHHKKLTNTEDEETIYQAVHIKNDIYYIIKEVVINLKKFNFEIGNLYLNFNSKNEINHPNLLKIYDCWLEQSGNDPVRSIDGDKKIKFYMQFEYFNGQTLEDYIDHQENEELKSADAHSIFIQILNTIIAIRKNDGMFEDLKLGSILISKNKTIKIIDSTLLISLRKMLEYQNNYKFNKKKDHSIENDEQSISNKIDLYLLGIIFFQLLLPFSLKLSRKTFTDKLLARYEFPKNFEKNHPNESKIILALIDKNDFLCFSANKLLDLSQLIQMSLLKQCSPPISIQ